MQAFDADAPPQEGPPLGALSSAAVSSTGIGAHEILSLVMPHLPIKDRAAVSRISRKWRENSVQQHHLWRTGVAGKSGVWGWDGLCHLVHTCNVGALKASIAFQPDYELMNIQHHEVIYMGPKRMALLLNAAHCTSLTSLHLSIDNSVGSFEILKPMIQGNSHNVLGIIEFPTSLRQLKLEFDCLVYLLIPNIAQMAALTALSCHIDGSWEENLPKAFPASLKRLEMYNSHCPPILPPILTTITRLESLQLIGGTETSWGFQKGTSLEEKVCPAISPDLSLLDVPEGKEEHDEWCRHLTYLGFSEKVFKGLPKKLPPALVTVELIYPDEVSKENMESLNLSVKEAWFTYDDLDDSDDSESDYEDSEGWMDDAVLDALNSCPNLKAVYSDNYRMRYMWNVPATQSLEPLCRSLLDLNLEYDIRETPLAITVKLGTVPLLPQEEWESVAGYGRQWTPWDQVK